MFRVFVQNSLEDRLNEEMMNMRTWLDHQRFAPTMFRQTKIGSRIVFYLYFDNEKDANTFAAAFGGRVESASRAINT